MNTNDIDTFLLELNKDPDHQTLISALEKSEFYKTRSSFFDKTHSKYFSLADLDKKAYDLFFKCGQLYTNPLYNIKLINQFIFSLVIMTYIWDLVKKDKLICNERPVIFSRFGNNFRKFSAMDILINSHMGDSQGTLDISKIELDLIVDNKIQNQSAVAITIPISNDSIDNYLEKVKIRASNLSRVTGKAIDLTINDLTTSTLRNLIESITD